MKLVLTLADKRDKLYFGFGVALAILCGFGLPSYAFLFGDIADSFSPTQFDLKVIIDKIDRISLILTIIGLVIWLMSYMFFTFLTIASESIVQKTKVEYLRSILRQDIAWFDSIDT